MAAKKTTRGMSAEHKAALAEGRAQGRAIRDYLEALEVYKPRRGRKRSPESMKNRLDKVESELATADPMKRVMLTQERMDLVGQLAAADGGSELANLEQDFVRFAKGYSQRKGISYAAWRAVGVPQATLKAAGIDRSEG